MAFVLGVGLCSSCSTQKDNVINRNWHALHTQYNILYNGTIAFEQGRAELNSGYRDTYWEILPVERLRVTEEIKLDSEDNSPNFILAEEKATKAIQKHSMDIRDREQNPKTDDAFLLLGKARYFDQRYIPALEAFNYILEKYVTSDKLNEAAIWREKTNMRLDNLELALKNLKRLLEVESLKDQEYADAYAVLAQCYIHLNAPDTALQKLKLAQAYTKKNTEKGRYRFIMGQLYDALGYKDSANYAYDQVIALKRTSPHVYTIHAHLCKIRNIPITDANKEMLRAYLTRLEEDRENRPFLDKIYREVARFHLANQSDSLALVYYNKSLKANRGDRKLNALNYQSLAEYYFDKNAYKTAGCYYDSTLTNLAENTKTYRSVKKKLDHLKDVIQYEGLVQYADSVITLYYMPEAERKTYFETYIAELKRRDEALAATGQKPTPYNFAPLSQTRGTFYFYNRTSLGYGKTTFKLRWGDRVLEDDWRWSNTPGTLPGKTTGNAPAINVSSLQNPGDNPGYTVDFYVGQIPTKASTIDSLKVERNFANYQLGLIYKEKFKDNQLAAAKLESVLASHPGERLMLPSKYHLYKIYATTHSPLAPAMKQDILNHHPHTRYAEILANPQAVLEGNTDSSDAKYEALYKLYKNQEFHHVITQSKMYSERFTGDPIAPKFELLGAYAIGRLQGFRAFKRALNYIALAYPNYPEGKKAAQLLAEQLPKWDNQEFSTETAVAKAGNWKVVFPLKSKDTKKALYLKERLEEVLKKLRYHHRVSKDVYTAEEQFVVVHGFRSKDFALGFTELIKNNSEYRITADNFVILSDHYKTVQIHKNLTLYTTQVLHVNP